jgi:hypothetical protein
VVLKVTEDHALSRDHTKKSNIEEMLDLRGACMAHFIGNYVLDRIYFPETTFTPLIVCKCPGWMLILSGVVGPMSKTQDILLKPEASVCGDHLALFSSSISRLLLLPICSTY